MSGLLLAALYGALSSVWLVAGAGAALALQTRHRTIAGVTAIGSGLLLAAASLELARGAVVHIGVVPAGLAILGGALAFSLINVALMRWDAHKRKRCGECARQPSETEMPGSGAAIAAGSLLDAIPEAMILGFAAGQSAETLAPLALIGAFGFANFAEGLSSTAGMRSAGRSRRYVMLLWSAAAAATTLAAMLGYLLFASGADYRGLLSAIAAGALIAVVVETMAPEAVAGHLPLTGALTAAGFILFLYALAE
jgi:ZIP family zinc transporter